MNRTSKIVLLVALSLIALIAVFQHAAISQDLAYHDLIDQRVILGIPNGWNVLSNFPFVIVGLIGLLQVRKVKLQRGIKTIYSVLFTGVFLVGWGSAFYHYAPGNDRLVYDRIPMTIVFMSLLVAIIAEHIDEQTGVRLLVPMLVIGIGSVLYWHITEMSGYGDLRLYGLVQFYPILFIPLILLLFPAPAYNRGIKKLIGVIGWYVMAKIAEYYDKPIYKLTGFVSGHTLKHLAAATATWYLVKMFQKNYIERSGSLQN